MLLHWPLRTAYSLAAAANGLVYLALFERPGWLDAVLPAIAVLTAVSIFSGFVRRAARRRAARASLGDEEVRP